MLKSTEMCCFVSDNFVVDKCFSSGFINNSKLCFCVKAVRKIDLSLEVTFSCLPIKYIYTLS